jgi:hypothetical protein
LALLATTAIAACDPPGVGDPCTPEVQPVAGTWSYGEVSVETRSLQCRTRTCMVYHFFPAGREEGEPDWRIPGQWPLATDETLQPCPDMADIRDFIINFCRRTYTREGAVEFDMAAPLGTDWYCNFDMALVNLSSPFCTFKCGGAGRTFECPEGYTCQEVVTLGPDAMRGSYCVPARLADCHPERGNDGKQDCCQAVRPTR